jgi:signal transduction histidine kinase
MVPGQDFLNSYAKSLEAYIARPGEALLLEAYLLGRQALTEGEGVIALVDEHQRALARALPLFSKASEEQHQRAFAFLLESISPFEMAYRSYMEANAQLQELARTLEKRVEERTNALVEQEARIRYLLQQTIEAQEKERKRLAQQLHDESGHELAFLRFTVDRLAKSLPATATEAQKLVLQIQETIDLAAETMRRIIADLHPALLDQLGLVPALRWLTERTLQPLNIEVMITTEPGLELPKEAEVVMFRIAQTAVDNIARYSQAKHVSLALQSGELGGVKMVIKDDGKGFDPSLTAYNPVAQRGLGLTSMRERATTVGGTIEISSTPDQGTVIEVWLPFSPVSTVIPQPAAEEKNHV